jgi:hypothetical protein
LFSARPPVQLAAEPTINVNFNGMDCRGPMAVQWLASLENLVEANATDCVLGSGCALVMNNFRVCHTRTGYSPRFGPDARWFVRGYFKRDLWSIAADPHEYLSAEEIRTLEDYGWLTAAGRLTARFQEFVDHSTKLDDVPDSARPLAEKAFNLTPVAGSRVV